MFIRNVTSNIRIRTLNRFCSHNAPRKTPVFENKPVLYGDEVSPPVRFVLMTASVLDIELKFHHIDLFCSEHKTKFYTKINPLQKVPALVAGDDVIRDSHAIAIYLCGKSKTRKIYPRDASTKAQIDQMLFFNSAELFPIDSAIYTEYFTGKWPADEEKVKDWYRLLDYLDNRLSERTWLAGDKDDNGMEHPPALTVYAGGAPVEDDKMSMKSGIPVRYLLRSDNIFSSAFIAFIGSA